jgi:hypothetical protein
MAQPRELKSRHLVAWLVTKQQIELDPGHVGGGDIGDVATCTFGHRPFRGGLLVWHRMMPKSEEAPAVCLCKAPRVEILTLTTVEAEVFRAMKTT